MHRVAANGASIPALGFGTWRLEGALCERMVETALGIGYRHIDTAQLYGNEREVGRAIRTAAVPREEIFLTTKVQTDRYRAGDLEQSVAESLRLLGVPWVDLLLLHWPNPQVPLAETMAALNRAQADGLTRHIGISNFTTGMIDEAVALAATPLVTDQVEYHPFLAQGSVLAACRAHGMALTAYCPLARGRVADDPLLRRIGAKHGRTASQVALRWLIQQPGVVAIPRTARAERAEENLAVFDFTLSETEMAEIAALADGGRLVDVSGQVWDPV